MATSRDRTEAAGGEAADASLRDAAEAADEADEPESREKEPAGALDRG